MAERKCGVCREPGHTRTTCRNRGAATVARVTDAILAEEPTPEQRTTPTAQTPAPWFGALFAGVLACGHRVDEGDMVRSRPTGMDDLECYAYCGQDDPAGTTCTDCTDGSDPTDTGDYVPEVHAYDPGSCRPCDTCHGTRLVPACTCTTGSPEMYEGPARDCSEHGEHVVQSDPDEPQAWERPTAANVELPNLPTVAVDPERVSALERLRNHPASHAPIVAVPDDVPVEPSTAITPYQVLLSTELGDPGNVTGALGWAGPLPVAEPQAEVATFGDPLPVAEEPKRKQTNQYGYLCKDPLLDDFRRHKNGNVKGITRCTTFVKAASDSTALSAWGKRNVVIGASRRPDLIATAHGRDVTGDREFLDGLVEHLENAADAKVSADVGTLVHTYTEKFDAGQITLSDIPPAYRGHVVSYTAALKRGGFRVVSQLMEGTIFLPHHGGVAGKFDRVLFHVPTQTYVMGDLKTGKNMTYGWDEIEAQEWVYTEGYNTFGTYDWDTDTWVPPQYRVRDDCGVVMWLPVQTPTKPYPAGWDVKTNGEPQAGVCYLLKTDLQRGRAHADLCASVREGRSNKGKPVRWENPPVNWEALFRGVNTTDDAGHLWEVARDAGVTPNALGFLVGLAQERLRSIGSQTS